MVLLLGLLAAIADVFVAILWCWGSYFYRLCALLLVLLVVLLLGLPVVVIALMWYWAVLISSGFVLFYWFCGWRCS